MAAPLSAGRQLTALRAEGLRVVQYRDWATHSRNHKGSWGPVYGVMIHHTVSVGTTASVELCYEGHSTLPGPLCHTVGAKDGTLYMVGNGRANHAGLGDGAVLRAVIAEQALPARRVADTDGNRHFYGIELVNRGDGRDPWPAAQVEAAARWAAALCRAHGWNERSVIGHLEWQLGKVDPRGFTMDGFRDRVREILAAPPGAGPTQEDDEMQLDDRVKLGSWVAKRWPGDEGLEDGEIYVRTALGSGYAHARAASEATRELLAEVSALGAVVERLADAVASGGTLTGAQAREAAEAGAHAALDRLGRSLAAG